MTLRTIECIQHYTVEQGWLDTLAPELVEASKEPRIMQFTPNDHLKRFSTVEAANSWHDNSEKNPVIYALRDETSRELAGIAWFSRQQHEHINPTYSTTFAIRLYDIARSQGLSYPFAQVVHNDYTSAPEIERGNIWLETDQDNIAAQKLYEKLGYTTILAANNRIIMGLDQ